MSFFICHMEADLKSVVIDYRTTTDVNHWFWGGTCICSPIFILYKELFCWSTFRSFQDVILTYSKGISPSRTSIGSTKCDHLYWGNLHDELLLGGESQILSSSTKRKAPYALLYLVHMIAVCSVVGRIAAILMYVLLDRYYDARKRYSRQVQSVWESSDAGVFVKYLLGHTSLLL